jgi:hypothetical protein
MRSASFWVPAALPPRSEASSHPQLISIPVSFHVARNSFNDSMKAARLVLVLDMIDHA